MSCDSCSKVMQDEYGTLLSCMVFLAQFPFKKLGWHLPFFFLRLIEIVAKFLPSFLKKLFWYIHFIINLDI